MDMNARPMETLREAIARLERRGFESAFRPLPDGRLEYEHRETLDPESLVIDEVVRFEGESNPEDEAVLFALRTPDGRIRGTFTATYGPAMDAASVAVIERLTPDMREPDLREGAARRSDS
jgi:hypothetical protein